MQYTNKSKSVTLIVTLVGTHFVREQQTLGGSGGMPPREKIFYIL